MIFGPGWKGTPAEEGAIWCDTPIDKTCIYCREPIKDGDSGKVMGVLGEKEAYTVAVHRECILLSTIGHHMDYCACTNYKGLSKRQAGLEMARLIELRGGLPPE